MSKKITPLIIIVLLLATFNSCGIGLIIRGAAKRKITVENNIVPPNYIEPNQTLIVALWGTKSYDKYAIKAFNKFYKGKKEFVNLGELKTNPKYEDLETYPFVFSQGPEDINLYEGDSFSYVFSGGRPFHIFDRKEKKFYMMSFHSGFFYRMIQAYAMKLNTYIKE